ncbi:MAG: hypothetical protein ABH836_02090 [Candidatus Omnitrophota bacterium]
MKTKISKKRFLYPSRKNGSILIISLWTLLFLSFFCATLAFVVYAKINTAKHLKERMLSYYLAKAGAEAAFQVLQKDETEYDFFGDAWSDDESLFKEVSLGAGNFTVSYDYAGNTYYGLSDESSKLNLNTALQKALVLFFSMSGCADSQAVQLAECVIDWRDVDNEPFPRGAEDDYYNNLEIPYNCKDANFESIEEVLLVKGMNNEIFSGIKENVTVFGNGAVNVNTADRKVLIALGIKQSLADKIINYRLKPGGVVVGDEGFFKNIDEISEKINLSEDETEIIDSLKTANIISVSTSVFRAGCAGKLNNSDITGEIVYILNRTGKIYYWKQK